MKAPKTFPVYVSNGSVTVSIIQTKNGKYLNYRLRWKEAGGEKKENFADYGKAYARAESVAKNIAEGRVDLTGVKVSDMELIADLKKQIEPTGLTLSQVVQRFMDAWEPDIKETEVKIAYGRYAEEKKKKGKFHQKDIRLIVGGLSAKFEKRLLSSLKREEVVSYISKGYENGRTINNRLNTVRGFFNWAKENQLISERNPHILEKVKTWDEERPDNYEESLMPAEDLKRLMVEICLKRDDEDELLIAVALMAFGGVRVNEFKRLRWENVKFDKGKLHAIQINAKEAKNPQRRTIELTDSLRNIIETVKRKESGPLTSYSSPERIIQKIAKRIGIRWHENTLRHTFLTVGGEDLGLSYHVVGVNDNLSFISHNITSFSKVEKTEETKALLGQQIERMEKETNLEIKDTQARSLICTLANLKKLYSLSIDVEMNSPDGRFHNPWTSLPADVRKTITINGKKNLCSIDIRSCHPSFFAEYIVSLISTPSAELLKEKEKWNDYFFNSAIHPLKTLANTLCVNYDDTENELGEITRLGLKKGFNSHLNSMGFNGSRFNPDHKNAYILNPLNRWIRTNFPLLYGIWMQTDLKETGNKICLNYESKIMQNPLLFKKAEELGVYIAGEHDGVSLYGDNVDDAEAIIETMRSISLELFGINLAVSRK